MRAMPSSVWMLRSVGALAALLVLAPAQASESHSERDLVQAFTLQNLAVYCGQFTPSALSQTVGKDGGVNGLAQHVKTEAAAQLPQEDAERLIRRSADAARAIALTAVRRHYDADRAVETARISQWCDAAVVPAVQRHIQSHGVAEEGDLTPTEKRQP